MIPSPNNTIITSPGSVIIDAYGNQWQIVGGKVVVNGKTDPTTRNVLVLAYENGKVWQMNTDRLWWAKAEPSDPWTPTYGTSSSPLVGVASLNNTVIVGSAVSSASPSGITDANDDHYTITPGGQVAVNGVSDPTTRRVIAIAYEKGVIWQENADRMWWSKSNAHGAWTPTYGTSISPIPIYAAIPGVTYFDGASVYYANTVTPRNYSVLTVADGDRGITFYYSGINTNNGSIHNVFGVLNLEVGGSLTSTGTLTSQGGIGGTATNIDLAYASTFQNNGRIDINNSTYVSNTLTVTMRGAQTTFANYGVTEANGAKNFVSLWSAPEQNPYPTSPFLGRVINNGLIQVSNGASMFLTTPVTGTGNLEADHGGWIVVNGPVGAGQTITLNSGHLAFGPKGSITNPSMQFLGRIVGESATSTINLEGSFGTSERFNVLSRIGAGLGELQVFDPNHVMVADLTFVGHFQLADFTLTPHAGGVPSANWTSLAFKDHVNTDWVAHS